MSSGSLRVIVETCSGLSMNGPTGFIVGKKFREEI
jgi:hypothetical protein